MVVQDETGIGVRGEEGGGAAHPIEHTEIIVAGRIIVRPDHEDDIGGRYLYPSPYDQVFEVGVPREATPGKRGLRACCIVCGNARRPLLPEWPLGGLRPRIRSEEHTSELQSH